MLPSNIMYDRRVVRGNTYAAQILPAETMAQDTMQGCGTKAPPPPPFSPGTQWTARLP